LPKDYSLLLPKINLILVWQRNTSSISFSQGGKLLVSKVLGGGGGGGGGGGVVTGRIEPCITTKLDILSYLDYI
jgi:hypothetical protein